MATLEWEGQITDEPRDQEADSYTGPHSYWSIGPSWEDGWSCELIARDDDLEEADGGAHLGIHPTEESAKAAAQAYEDAHSEPAAHTGI